MNNPFETIENRLDKLEKILTNIGNIVTRQQQPTVESPSRLIKIEAAVTITGYKKGYIYELVHRNKIPYIKFGAALRFDPEELEAWMRAGRPNIIQHTIKILKESE